MEARPRNSFDSLVCVCLALMVACAASDASAAEDPFASISESVADDAVDLDAMLDVGSLRDDQVEVAQASYFDNSISSPTLDYPGAFDVHEWQFLPESIMYKAYLAGMKESRLAGHYFGGSSGVNGQDWLFEGTLGGRFGVLRYGTRDFFMPQGFQMDIEGAAQVRLNTSDDIDVQATDYRIGIPLTFAHGAWQVKTGYYHLSSHAGDEFLIKRTGFERLNYARDVLLLGVGYNVTPDLRVYAEAGWAFFSDVANEWEFQFGIDYAPGFPTGVHGAPFVAFNAHLREELNYGGNVAFQAGWAWRTELGRLLRAGLHVYVGESNQYSFFDFYEEQVGIGLWYDY